MRRADPIGLRPVGVHDARSPKRVLMCAALTLLGIPLAACSSPASAPSTAPSSTVTSIVGEIALSDVSNIEILNGTQVTSITDNPSKPFSLGFAGQPAWSPDGKHIAFTGIGGGHGGSDHDIFTMNVDGTNVVKLTGALSAAGWQNVAPAWSPDGTKIAFVRKLEGADSDIFMMNVDGSGLTRITSGSGRDYRPTWSPDGIHIAFQRYTDSHSSSGIFVIKVDGSGLRQIVSGNDDNPNWSHDGTRIAFWEGQDHGVLQVITLESRKVSTVATAEQLLMLGRYGDPSWSPDDTTIAVAGDTDTPAAVSLVQADGTGVTGLSGLRGVSPSWKPV